MLLRKMFAPSLLLGMLLTHAAGQNASDHFQNELIGTDRAIWEAIAGPHPDMDRVSAELAPDYLDIDSGTRHTREEMLQYLRTLTKFSFQYKHARAYVLSPASGYVIAELSYSSVENGKPATGNVLTTTVFSKKAGRWLAHLHTEMEIKPETR